MSNTSNEEYKENNVQRNFTNKPVELGKEYTVQITETSLFSDGSNRRNGKPVKEYNI